ncbi:hypothetical protein [Fundidesulfovibrio agrisoli]|uniref:hypothetical protein n=1 Tax=Fundidesulfovibrio agrisoli TaxID=2922717 RepID=UPI001FABF66D|nr:hypothetical protein [Fundidesulfovibrio agrisoli]
MQYAELRSAKYFALACAIALALLITFGKTDPLKPSPLEGVINSVSEKNGAVLGYAVDSEDQTVAVNVPLPLQGEATKAALEEGQAVKFMVTDVRGTKRGVVCELVSIVSYGPPPPPDASAPKKNAALPVDDLKPGLGVTGQ